MNRTDTPTDKTRKPAPLPCGLCGEPPHTNSRPCPEAGYVTVGNEDWA